MRTYKSVEVEAKESESLAWYLHENEICFEPSGCFNLVHFEILCNEEEERAINEFLSNL